MPSQHGCLFAGNESWTDLNLLLSTRGCGQRALAGHFGLGSGAGARHGCAILAPFSTDATLCHYRRESARASLWGATEDCECGSFAIETGRLLLSLLLEQETSPPVSASNKESIPPAFSPSLPAGRTIQLRNKHQKLR